MDTLHKRGGRREGAGRKKIYVRTTSFRVTEEANRILEQVDNRTKFINDAIIANYN